MIDSEPNSISGKQNEELFVNILLGMVVEATAVTR